MPRRQAKPSAPGFPSPGSIRSRVTFKLLPTSSPVKHLDDAQSPIRSAYFEQAAQAGKPTQFKIEYEYTADGVWFDIEAGGCPAL